MAIEKDVFNNYIKQRESPELKEVMQKRTKYKYTHNKIFDALPPTINKNLPKPNKQTVHKRCTNGKQTVNKRCTERETNGKQTVHKLPSFLSLSTLAGLQRKIIISLYENCKINGGKVTQEITIDHLANVINGNKNSIKTTILRLKRKGCIRTAEYKDGRAGWAKYAINHELYTDILHNEKTALLGANGKQTVNKRCTERGTERGTNSPSSSSLLNINKTTTIDLPTEWLEIDINQLSEIGFTNNHLVQLYKLNKYQPKEIQSSINYFAYDLKYNDRAKKITKSTPLAYFMCTLKSHGLISAPKNYESSQDRAVREYVEREKALAEKRKQMLKELKNVEYQKWRDSLTDGEIEEIKPGFKQYNKGRTEPMVTGVLFPYFEKNVWSDIYKKFLAGSNIVGKYVSENPLHPRPA